MKKTQLKIISGGQTGADRAALDFAIAHKIPYGGWCPKGRLAEDGVIPQKYKLRETRSVRYDVRTRRNVRDADATVIFSTKKEMTGGPSPRRRGCGLAGGTLYTFEYAQKKKKPCLCLLGVSVATAAGLLKQFIQLHHVLVLNVAGPRASKEAGVYKYVMRVLRSSLAIFLEIHRPSPTR